MSGVGESFTCANCGGAFRKNRSDEEAMAETESIFSQAEIKSGVAIVCDDCFNSFMGWFKSNPEAREN
jgi:hypothetical protein